MSEESTARNLEELIQLGKPKIFIGECVSVNSSTETQYNNIVAVVAVSNNHNETIHILNITSGICEKTIQFPRGPYDYSISHMYYTNGKLAVILFHYVKILNTNTNVCIQTSGGDHTDYVNSAHGNDNILVTGSNDKTIKIWDINSGKCLKTLEGHTHSVKSVFVKDNLIISGSSDKTIKIWDIETGICLKTLEGHMEDVRSIFVKDNIIFSGSEDNTIRIWDINTGKCLKTLTCHTDWVMSLFAKDNMLISGAKNGIIKIYDINSGACIKTLQAHTDWINTVYIRENLIVTGSYDDTIMITPICLFPSELSVFQQVIDSYYLAPHLKREISNYFGAR